jgi:hypothetical protein
MPVEMEKDSPDVKIDKIPSQTMTIDPFISRNNDQPASPSLLNLVRTFIASFLFVSMRLIYERSGS